MKLVSVALVLLSFTTTAKSLTIMQYNVENLFDTTHDKGKEDWTYLPLSTKNSTPDFNKNCDGLANDYYVKECLSLNWSDTVLTKKIVNLSQAIRSFDSSNKGPDILVLEEVENKNVLNKLATEGLSGLGYRYTALIEGDDVRGIDVGIISKYPIKSSKRYPIILNGKTLHTRGITEAHINVNGKEVVVFGNHWPSQMNPNGERVAAAKILAAQARLVDADLVVAVGDFNALSSENAFDSMPDFVDAETQARKVLSNLNPGTHFYKGEWNSLDHIFILKSSVKKADFKTFQIMNRSFLLRRDFRTGQQVPNRFNVENGHGHSDHLPLGLNFNI